jgi:alpha-methylacyl-CoA racemase
MVALPLDGIRVLDLSRLLPGPFCTLLLADMGADVIKVEDTGAGDYIRWMPPLAGEYSALFHALNRNKRAVSIDLKDPAGRDVFLRLAEHADVVVESFRPGVMERLGIGPATLRERNRGLVVCSITGYGQDGPYRDRAGHDLDYIALSGVQSLTLGRDGAPAVPGVQIGDIGGGAQNAAIAILGALVGRQRSGRGIHIDVSMLDGLVGWLSMHAARHLAGEPAGNALDGRHPCYRLYRTADSWIAVGALEPKFWSELCTEIGVPHLAASGLAEGAEADAVAGEVETVLGVRTTAEWMERLDGHDVCVEPVLGLDEVFAHAQVRARGLLLPQAPGHPVAAPAHPLVYDGVRPGARRPAPGVGEHTAEVLAEAGIDSAAYAALLDTGVIR